MDDRGTGYDEVDATGWTGGPSSSSHQPQHYSYVKTKKVSRSGVDNVSSGPAKYNMKHRRRGTALIISNRNFAGRTLGSRPGTEADVERMECTLTNLGFDVDTFEDLTTERLQACLVAKANLDHSDSDCFMCVVMTHGTEDHIFDTEGKEIHLKTLISFFGGKRCSSLIGKPKIFIINACQGDKVDAGHDVADAECWTSHSDDEEGEEGEEILVQNLPYELDFLYIHSTMHGYFSFRHTTEGSQFIRTLCDVIEKYSGQLEICQLLTVVNRRMAVEFKSKAKSPPFHGKKQCPCFLSLLTKQLYFTRNSTKT